MGRKRAKLHSPKNKASAEGDESAESAVSKPLKPAPARINSPFAALKGVQLAPAKKSSPPRADAGAGARAQKSAPTDARVAARAGHSTSAQPSSQELTYAERIAVNKAYAGVQPMDAIEARRAKKGKSARRIVQPAQKSPQEAAAQAQRDAEARDRLDELVGRGHRFVIERDGDEVLGRRQELSAAKATQLLRASATPERRLDLHGLRADDAARQVVTFTRAAQRAGARLILIVHGRGQHSEGGVGVLADVVVTTLSRGGAAPIVQAFMSASSRLGGSGAMLVCLTPR